MKTTSLLVGAYLVGAVPFSYIIVRWLRRTDVRTVGSGNVGATNTLRAAGRKAALIVLLLDVGKGLAPVLLARQLGQPPAIQAAAAAAAVLGHVFPLYLGFRGGKGVATAAGGFLALSPAAFLLSATLFALVLAWKRWVSLASIAGASVYPALLYALGAADGTRPPDPLLLAVCVAVSALVISRHRANVRRLLQGQEPRLGANREGGE